MELKGKVKVINDLSTESLQKKQIVITLENSKYQNEVAIDFLKDKVSLLNNINSNDIVTIKINIQSREYQGKWYTNINGWKISNDLATLP